MSWVYVSWILIPWVPKLAWGTLKEVVPVVHVSVRERENEKRSGGNDGVPWRAWCLSGSQDALLLLRLQSSAF